MDKEYLLTKSKAFCILPWVHIHSNPAGDIQLCCISKPLENKRPKSLEEIVNSESMKQVRNDLLNDKQVSYCTACYDQEAIGTQSFRQSVNDTYGKHFDEAVSATLVDGTTTDFKMRYFDIRFSNICNFKCRTCTSDYSSQWEQEDLKANVPWAKVHSKHTHDTFFNDIKSQIPNIRELYFAGGEPLITEEHYLLLEELIRQNRHHDVILRYNTNLSVLKFKDKDLINLWSRFKHRVQLYASIDHYGNKAEYIRHGTNWNQIEKNYNLIRILPFVNLQINTVLSVFNALTIDDFYRYMYESNLYDTRNPSTLYFAHGPEAYSPYVLPKHLKDIAVEKLNKLYEYMVAHKFDEYTINTVKQYCIQMYSKSTYESHIKIFKDEVTRIDAIRNESFVETFPELAELMS